ncbi:MAG: DUF1559 domain-containing protein [Planctomycetes bacterium]|nr:DUF1559 domain-containing protein [Planctomycetota bacterium]
MRRAFTLIELLVVIAIIAILCGLLPGDAGFDMMFRLLAGWVIYPIRLVLERSVDWPAIGLCTGCLAGLIIGVHWFGQWFASHRSEDTVWPWSRTFKLVGIIMMFFLAGIAAISVTHQVFWLATTEERLTQSTRMATPKRVSENNLKQIVLAAHNHHHVKKELPPGGMFNQQGRALHGWATLILPYVDQEPLFKQIDLDKPWDVPANAKAVRESIPPYLHPSVKEREAGGYPLMHYAGNIHVFGPKPIALKDITDSAAETILFGEITTGLKPWAQPGSLRDPALGLNTTVNGFGGPSPGGTQFGMADGSVRTIRNDISPQVLKALGTPRGGEKIEPFD